MDRTQPQYRRHGHRPCERRAPGRSRRKWGLRRRSGNGDPQPAAKRDHRLAGWRTDREGVHFPQPELIGPVIFQQILPVGGIPCAKRYLVSPLLLGARHRLYSLSVQPPLTPINGVLFIMSATLLTIVAS